MPRCRAAQGKNAHVHCGFSACLNICANVLESSGRKEGSLGCKGRPVAKVVGSTDLATIQD